MTQWTYFAADGSYGDAQDLIVVDTTNWTEYEWESIALGEQNTGFPQLAEHIAFGRDNYAYLHNGVFRSARTAQGGVSYDR